MILSIFYITCDKEGWGTEVEDGMEWDGMGLCSWEDVGGISWEEREGG